MACRISGDAAGPFHENGSAYYFRDIQVWSIYSHTEPQLPWWGFSHAGILILRDTFCMCDICNVTAGTQSTPTGALQFNTPKRVSKRIDSCSFSGIASKTSEQFLMTHNIMRGMPYFQELWGHSKNDTGSVQHRDNRSEGV